MYFKKSKAGAGISADGLYYFLSPKTMHYSEAVQFCQSHLDLYQLAQQRIDVNLWPVIGQYMKRLIEDKNDLGTGIFFDFFDVEYRGQRVRKIYGRFAKMFTNPCSGRQLARFGLLYKAFNRVLPIDDSSVKAYALCQGDILNLGGNKYEIEATPKDRGLTRIWSEENGCVEMLDPRDVMDTEVEDDYIGEEDAGELELFDEEFQPQYDK
ncbi:uncharacterized protein LOC108674918 isoform X2 [Hyalella azteca]|nr:uncharacterized protein LOC108674918 isoform X2 [Hyalella azteca]